MHLSIKSASHPTAYTQYNVRGVLSTYTSFQMAHFSCNNWQDIRVLRKISQLTT